MMLTSVCPKLPMRNKALTKDFYIDKLGFRNFGYADFEGYLMVERDQVQIHFFSHENLDPKDNYGQVYIRTDHIDELYRQYVQSDVRVTKLESKPWGQKEFSILDPDNNLLTFGEAM